MEKDWSLEAARMMRGGHMRGREWPLMVRLTRVSDNLVLVEVMASGNSW